MIVEILDSGGGDPLGYLMGDCNWKGESRKVPPEISRGSVERFGLLLDPAYGYASIVFSFEERAEDLPREMMDRFISVAEEFLLPNIRKQACEKVWVRHVRENGSVDYHLLVSLMLAANGLSIALLSAYRGDIRHLFAFKEWANCHFGFSSPTEIHRGRIDSFVPHRLPSKNKALFKAVDSRISRAYEDGLINDRPGVVAFITDQGYAITRSGKYSLTVADEAGTKVRLKGFKYRKSFTREGREVERAEWNRINALPQVEREKYWAKGLSAAISQRRAHLRNTIRAALRLSPFLDSERDWSQSPTRREPKDGGRRQAALMRGSPARLFAARLAGNTANPALSPAIVSLCRDLPRLLPNASARREPWSPILSSFDVLLHENQDKQAETQPYSGIGHTPRGGSESHSRTRERLEAPSVANLGDRGSPGENEQGSDDTKPEHSRYERRIAFTGRGFVACHELTRAIERLRSLVRDLSVSKTLALPRQRSMADILRDGKRLAHADPEQEI
jgi:hypothetical protein